jgi:lysozyme family protein
MQRNFERSLSAVLAHEGGYVDHPKDPGGATNMGITHKTLALWRKVTPYWDLPKSEIKALKRSEAAAIYRANYWDKIKGDDLPSGLDYAVMDYAVNSGPGRAAKALQRLVGAAEDGQIGPDTLRKVAAVHPDNLASLIIAYCDGRMTFLKGLPTFGTFGKGWTSRVTGVRKLALEMAGDKLPIDLPDDPEAPASELAKPARPVWPFVIGAVLLAIAAIVAMTVRF